ncbi:hypothetical protein K2P56_04560 [Patescibacteria group bacterium]|nr:hypothetical protein [Patescibacteria group bacterium]
MQKKIIITVAVLIGIGAIIGGVYYWNSSEPQKGENVQVGATTTPNYTIELVDNAEIRDIMPNLDRGITFGSTVPEAARVSIQKNYDAATLRLKEDPMRADDWFNLGIFYHAANDFKGAEEVWLFLLKVVPNSAVPLDNLGKMYKFQIKDFPKAESYFKQSIALNPDSTTPYFELFELYRYLYKTDTNSAIEIITQAANRFTENPDPHMILGSYYRDIKNYAGARAEFTKALDIARELKNVQLIDAIGQEIANLPQ